MFWFWPCMTMESATFAPADGGAASGASHQQARSASQPAAMRPVETPRLSNAIPSSFASYRHDVVLHLTTTLSRSWSDCSRFFGRLRDMIAYERLMHASFGWALSPMQRLLPSGAWPMAYAAAAPATARSEGASPFGPFDVFGLGAAWCRGLAQGATSQGAPCWQARRAAPQPAREAGAPTPGDMSALLFAPLLGVAAGLQSFAPTAGFGLFG